MTNQCYGGGRVAPSASRNTSSYIIRCEKSGGITSPAILSPFSDTLEETAKKMWGVDCYGSNIGLIRQRYPVEEAGGDQEEGAGEDYVSRIDRRFKMIIPKAVDEDELKLNDRLYWMENDLKEIRRRLESIEIDGMRHGRDKNVSKTNKVTPVEKPV